MSRRIIGLLAVIGILVAGCGGSGTASGEDPSKPPATPVKIRLALVGPGEEILYVMKEMAKVTPNQGKWYQIEWSRLQGTPLAVQGLASGTLDAGTVGSLTVANALDQGADLVLTGQFIEERSGWASTTWLTRKDSGINSVAGLRGKTIGTPSVGAFTDYIADAYIRDHGKLEANKDYKKIEVPFPNQEEQLQKGQIDAGVFPQPFFGKAMSTGNYKPLFRALDEQPKVIPILEAFRRDYIEQHPVTVKKFLEDWTTAAKFVEERANRDAVISASNKAFGLPVPVLQQFLLKPQLDYYRTPNGTIDTEVLQANWDFFREQGGIKSRLKVSDHIIPEFLPAQT